MCQNALGGWAPQFGLAAIWRGVPTSKGGEKRRGKGKEGKGRDGRERTSCIPHYF